MIYIYAITVCCCSFNSFFSLSFPPFLLARLYHSCGLCYYRVNTLTIHWALFLEFPLWQPLDWGILFLIWQDLGEKCRKPTHQICCIYFLWMLTERFVRTFYYQVCACANERDLLRAAGTFLLSQ